MRKFLLILLLLTAAYFIVKFGIDIYELYFVPKPMMLPAPPPPMSVEAGPIKLVIDEATPWESLVKLVSTVLVTYLGVKVINKYVK